MTNTAKYRVIARKYAYYATWYQEIPMKDRRGWLGKWVKDRAKVYHGILLDCEKEVEAKSVPTGNYKSQRN